MNLKINPKFVNIKKGSNIVILVEEEFDRILDILDSLEAERVLADDSDPVIKWEDVCKKLDRKKSKSAPKKRTPTKKESPKQRKVK